MPTDFPSSVDTFTNPLATDPMDNPSHSKLHTDANDAIVAIEEYIGVVGSTDPNSIEYRLSLIQTGAGHVWNETPAGTVDGSNVSFTLAQEPVAGSVLLFLNGVLQREGAGHSFVISGDTITFDEAPWSGCWMVASYVAA